MSTDSQWIVRRSGQGAGRPDDPREPYDHDLARVIHSASFRRLQSKTQVLGLGESDFYRTRLTHSIEVAQIATGIKRWLEQPTNQSDGYIYLPEVPQVTAISLAHDIGHPPFGHGGEVALNFMMRGMGGFEGNAQTLRILAHLESKTKSFGLDLTRRTMLGVLKYPAPFSRVAKGSQTNTRLADREPNGPRVFRTVDAKLWRPPKCFYDEDSELVDWILEPLTDNDRNLMQSCTGQNEDDHGRCIHKSLDTTIMDLADDISYAVHDLEDAIHMKFVRSGDHGRQALTDILSSVDSEWLKRYDLEDIANSLFSEKWERKEAISKLVHSLICSTTIKRKDEFDEPLLKYRVSVSREARSLIDGLQELVVKCVIRTPSVQTLEYSGQQIVMELFEAMNASPSRLLPEDTQKKLGKKTGQKASRVVCDHISGMTDDYAADIYERLFTPKSGSLFQKM